MAGTKVVIRLVTLLVALVALHSVTARAAEMDAANRAFDEGNYAEAKAQYSELVRQGATSANLFYNLGNTEFRLGEPGRAILEYEHALALEPAHPEARRNLKHVRERTGARVPDPRWYDVLVLNWRPGTFAIVAAASIWIVLLGIGSRVFLRRGGSGLVFLVTVAAATAVYAGFGLWYSARDRDLGIILPREAVARVAPAEQSAVAGTLPAGSRVRVQATRGDWVYCQLPGEGLGWFPAGSVERVRLDS